MVFCHMDVAQLADFWVADCRLLWRGLLCTLVYRFWCEHIVWFLSSRCLRVELLSGMINMLNFIRSCIILMLECVEHIFMYLLVFCVYSLEDLSSVLLTFWFWYYFYWVVLLSYWVVLIFFVLWIWVSVGSVYCESFLPVLCFSFS